MVLLYLPDGPHKGRLFSEYERTILVWRVSKDRRGVKSPKFKLGQMKEAMIDPKTWLLCLSSACFGILNGGVVNFKSALIAGFGFTGVQANLLGMPSGPVQIVGCVGFGLLARQKNMKGVAVVRKSRRNNIPYKPLSNIALHSCLLARYGRPDRYSDYKPRSQVQIRSCRLCVAPGLYCCTGRHQLGAACSQCLWAHQTKHSAWTRIHVRPRATSQSRRHLLTTHTVSSLPA